MPVASKTPARKPAARKPAARRSGNPATAAAAKREATELAAAQEAERAASQARIREQFQELALPAPVFDEDGYEVIPDKSAEAGGSYKFKVKGQAFVLPNLQYLPLAVAQQLGNLKSEQEAQALIFGRYVPDLLDVASQDELMHVMKRWMDYSKGISLGE